MQLSKSLEDYLETILLLSEGGVVRVSDVAERLGVKKPSVVAAVRQLKERELLVHEPYGDLVLTEAGRRVAVEIYRRHQALFSFLSEVLGVSPALAEEDACRIEHNISSDTMDRLVSFVEFVQRCPGSCDVRAGSLGSFARDYANQIVD